jgi:hypothetical protein
MPLLSNVEATNMRMGQVSIGKNNDLCISSIDRKLFQNTLAIGMAKVSGMEWAICY